MFTRLLSRYWLLIPLLIIAIVVRDWVEDPPVSDDEETIDMRSTRSDYYLEDFTTRKFAADGTLQYELHGESLAHYPDDDRSEIISPLMFMHRPDAQWRIESSRGRFDTEPDIFTLLGDVLLERTSAANNQLLIRTSDLSVATDDNLVSTAQQIEIIAEDWTLTATGLQSAIDEGKLTLLSNVSGRYKAPLNSQ